MTSLIPNKERFALSYRARGIRNWLLLLAVIATFAAGGFAIAQEGNTPEAPAPADADEGLGPPWLRSDAGDRAQPGPPPWAGQDGNDDDGLGPRWMRGDAGDWRPGTPGPPPWANARWMRGDAGDWRPGTPGPPPWAGQGDDADETDD